MGEDGYVRITDMGISKMWTPDNANDTSGTPGYMAPEIYGYQPFSGIKADVLKTATYLFNEKGFFNVSMQENAKSLNISPGNLTYHFPKKQNLLESIQKEIIAKSTLSIKPRNQLITLGHLEDLFHQFFEVQRAYSFYFSNLQYLSHEYPDVVERYKEVSTQRLAEAQILVDYYVQTGRLLPPSTRIHHGALIQNLWISNTFWRLKSELIGGPDFQEALAHVWQTIFPYLTDKGYEEYLEIQQIRKTQNLAYGST